MHPALIVIQILQNVVGEMIIADLSIRGVAFSPSCRQHLDSPVGENLITVRRDVRPVDL